MKRYYLIYLAGALALIAALGGGIALAQNDGPDEPIGPHGVADALGTRFTYQGKLEKDGSPVSGDCPMIFRLYDAASGGLQVGSTINRTVTITDGLFAESLDFGTDTFTGARRWLEVEVDCDGDSTYADLGRQELTAAPYALGLRPGAVISGTGTVMTVEGTNTSGTILHVENIGGGASDSAVYGESAGGYGVRASSENNVGVYGTSESNHGMLGKSSDGYGVVGESKNSYGVYAAGGAGDLRLYNGDIHSNRESSSDITLHSNDDLYIHLDDDDNNPVKVFSELQILNGNDTTMFSVGENGAVSWYTQTAYISIPAAAFRPQEDGYDFRNIGTQVINNDGDSDQYNAQVQLPHGATVTKITFYYSDNSSSDASVSLRRTSITSGGSTTMASITSQGSGLGHTETTAIDPDTIDNSSAAYYLSLLLPDSDTVGIAVLIEYAYTGPH